MGKTVRRLASVATMALAACSPVGLMLAAPGLLQARPAKTAQDAPDNAIVAWTYTVQSGDTFVSIARRMGVPMAALAAENKVPLPYLITVGQVLRRPALPYRSDGEAQAPQGQSAQIPPAQVPPTHASPRTTPQRLPRPAPRPAPPPRPEPAPAPAHAREAGAPRLVWPTSGSVISRFGTPVDGRTNPRGSSRANNGIDLAAFAGMTVHASAAGKVIFAGNEPERFGQLIVIDHGRGWVTAYAYLGRIDVKQGQQVAARQSIARIGKSGEARKPTLHFELRRDNVPRDPAPYLPVRL